MNRPKNNNKKPSPYMEEITKLSIIRRLEWYVKGALKSIFSMPPSHVLMAVPINRKEPSYPLRLMWKSDVAQLRYVTEQFANATKAAKPPVVDGEVIEFKREKDGE